LRSDDVEPKGLVGYNEACKRSESAVHFFLDDRQIQRVWRHPDNALPRLLEHGVALSPDFSVYTHMPIALQIYQVYRSRWCGRLWQTSGVRVVPTLQWAGPETYDLCFDGLRGSVFAVSQQGARGEPLFERGLLEAVRRLQPELLLSYGRLGVDPGVPVRVYPTHIERRYGGR
jgi:hypothetical protein